MIKPRRQDQKQVVQHHWFVIKVELNSFMVQFNICHFGYDVLKVRLPPCFGGMCHHSQYSVIKLFVFVI